MKGNVKYIVIGGFALIVLLFAWYYITPGSNDVFAKCLEEKGAKFYGAFWCPNCETQKKLFGKSASRLPYIECSTADGKGQLSVCEDASITSYPTWEFAGGDRQSGVIQMSELAEKTGCELPN
jgi:thiol-disulfide isomerase/thioredoxin